MAPDGVSSEDRVSRLLAQVDELVQANNLSKASEVLKEASQLDANNIKIKNAWSVLQEKEQSGAFLDVLTAYLQNHEEDSGRKALETLRVNQLSPGQAVSALKLLFTAVNGLKYVDTLTGVLINQSVDARKTVASLLTDNATKLFDDLYDRGDESLRALSTVVLDDGIWSSHDKQQSAQQDVFRLSTAKLMAADVDHPERAMRLISRQVAIAPSKITSLLDESTLAVVLENLDIRLDAGLRSQALLAASKILEAKKEHGEAMFDQFITSAVAKQTNDDLIIAFSAASAIFPVIPAAAAKLFMTDGFVQQLVPNLERNSEAAGTGKKKSKRLEQAALELLSAACVDKACRGAIYRYCSSWLQSLSKEQEGGHRALATLILAKLNATTQEDVTSKLADLALSGDSQQDQAIEGLAYTSLQPKIKEEIASDQRLLKTLVSALTERPNAVFGCLTVFSNLLTYRLIQTDEQKKMEQLKAYANSSKPEAKDPLDNDSYVTTRAKRVLDANVVPALVGCCKQTTSLTNVASIVHILLCLSREQKHRAKLAQQGAVKLLLQVRERMSQSDKATTGASTTERNAAHALARILISTNPAHIFTSGLPASSAVGALIPLLSRDQDSEQRDLLPVFEALLALTNLSSMEDDSARELQIRMAWDKIEDLLFSSNTMVQRASVELVCNLMISPMGVAKFADGSKDAKRRLQILLALADVEDLATRRGAGGALAMLTEWDAVVTAVLERERGVAILLGMCEEDSDEMRHRGIVCVLNIVSALGQAGVEGVKAMQAANAAEIIREALKKSKNQEVLGVGVEVLKKL